MQLPDYAEKRLEWLKSVENRAYTEHEAEKRTWEEVIDRWNEIKEMQAERNPVHRNDLFRKHLEIVNLVLGGIFRESLHRSALDAFYTEGGER